LDAKKKEQYNKNIINEFNILIGDINNKLNELSEIEFNIDRNQIDNLITTTIYYKKSKDNLFLIS
jgi:predicted methyltransferase